MSPIDMLHAAQAVWDGIGVGLAVTAPVIICGGLFHVLLSVSRDK
jgi:hypothetical protein